MVISDQFRSQTVSLNGLGVAPPGVSLSPAGTMSFPATAVGARSTMQAVTLTNNGGLPLNIQSVSVTGDFALVSGGTCGSGLAPATTCTYQVVFAPTAGGSRSGALVLVDNAANASQTLSLTGSGVDFSLAADGSTTISVANGKSAIYPLLLSSAAGMSGSATLTCTGAPVNATCVVSPTSAPLGATTLVTVTAATGVTTTTAQRESPGPGSRRMSPLVFAGLLPIGLLIRRRGRVMGRLAMLAILCVGLGAGCGSGRAIPVMGDGGGTLDPGAVTPAGSYTLTVTATASGLTRTMNLSLTVQ